MKARSGRAEPLDERLERIASLVPACALAADIGADHGLLGTALLRRGVCGRVLFADISEKALSHARETVRRCGFEDRACFAVADGLEALRAVDAPCGCAVIAGMGGKTIAEILRGGAGLLPPDAALVLSAHTEHRLVREAVQAIGWHIAREEVCLCAGRYYLVWRAEPGAQAPWTEAELLCGRLLWREMDEVKRGYLRHRLAYLTTRAEGLRRREEENMDAGALRETELALAYLKEAAR